MKLKKWVILLLIILLVAYGSANKYSSKEKGDKALSKVETEFCIPEVKAYTYPQQFVLGPNLNAAITELAIMYDEFDSNRIKEEDYKESIIFRYCKNSRQTFDYLEQLKEEYNGVIPREQVEYIQYSLTGEWVDFKDEIPKEGLNIIQSSSGFCDGKIKSYQADCAGDEVNLLAEFEIVEDGTQITYLYELNIVLVKNPESCFDGYSIKSLSSKDITKPVYGDNKEHTFRGVGSEWEDNGVFEFENYGGKDDVVYDRYIRINLSENPTLAEYVRKNCEKELEVTYIFYDSMTEPVYEVVPISIRLCE